MATLSSSEGIWFLHFMNQQKEQKRILGLTSATCTVVCSMIGAGIFMATGLYAAEIGSVVGILVIWGISGLLALCGSFCAIELASIWPEAGGNYIYKEYFWKVYGVFGRIYHGLHWVHRIHCFCGWKFWISYGRNATVNV